MLIAVAGWLRSERSPVYLGIRKMPAKCSAYPTHQGIALMDRELRRSIGGSGLWASMSSCEIELAREPNTKQKHAHKAQRVSYVREGSRRFL